MFYFKDDKQITVYFSDGKSGVWELNHPDFEKVEEMCRKADWIAVQCLHNEARTLTTAKVVINDDGTLTITADSHTHTRKMSDTTLGQFISLLKEKGTIDTEIERIKPFLINMFQNPYIDAVTELYDYCKAMDFEITEDGCFLAYKNVNEDLSSKHDGGKTKHVIGEYTEVDEVDTDRTNTCSKGLHFCSKGYLSSYTGKKTIVVKINPKDVASIPIDYNFQKGRCKRYLTVGVLGKDGELETTNIEAMTEGKVKTVKTEKAKEKAQEKAKKITRIEETYSLMQTHNDAKKVAEIMSISVDTVKRNMAKYKEKYQNEN